MSMSEPAAASPKRLGDFEIVREIGRGGMGVVYEAWQSSLKRRVALKVLSGQLGLTSQAVVRFRREAEAAAKLHHTNIVPIYATGEQDGTHYYAMELIEGPSLQVVIRALKQGGAGVSPAGRDDTTTTLSAWVMETITGLARAHPKSEPEAPARGPAQADSLGHTGGAHFDTLARLMAEVADGLDYAHQQGVIHRDIKPSNLLLNPVGPVADRSSTAGTEPGRYIATAGTELGRYTSVRLSINDFGLARVLEQPGMTMTGEFMGTPRYMSPEQIAAGRAPLDHRTDVYSLGATLYELLTLQPPFPGERREQVIAQILHKDPTPPRRVNRKVPVDLETICLKALEKDPDRRYQTAGQMAEDLRRYVNRFAISAKRAGPITRTIKWCRRRPAVAGLLGVVVVLATAAGALAYGVHRSNVRVLDMQRQKAIDDALLAAMSGEINGAEEAIRRAELYGASTGWVRMLRGQVALQQGRGPEALEHLEQAARLLPHSVAAKAMLATACGVNALWDRCYRLLGELDRMSPLTAEDYLFKGDAERIVDPVRALESLDQAVKLRSSALFWAIRAGARTSRAVMSGSPSDAELALQDAAVALQMLPENPLVLWQHLRAQLAAASLFQETGQRALEDAAWAAAERDALALEQFPSNVEAHRQRACFYRQRGQWDAELDEWRRLGELTGQYYPYARTLYERGEFARASRALDDTPPRARDVYFHIHRAFIVADLPDGYSRAMQSYEDAVGTQSTGIDALDPAYILYFLGRRSEADAVARRIRAQVDQAAPWMMVWYGHIADYACAAISAEELLAIAGVNRLRQCEAHFSIGLRVLADGDRAAAAEHFCAAVDTHVLTFYEHAWSRNFLARLEQDPTWPPWIPVKAGNEATRQQGNERSAGAAATDQSGDREGAVSPSVRPVTQPASAPNEGQL